MIGRHHIGALVIVVDRRSKKITAKQSKEVTKSLIDMSQPLKPISKTITSDNGKELAYRKSD